MKHVVVICTITVAIFLTTLSAIYTRPLLESLNIWPKTDPITELYFSEPSKLPSKFTPSTDTRFDITLQNHEFTQMIYDLTVEQTDSQGANKTTLATASLSLNHSQQIRRTISVRPADLPGSSQLIVTVRYRHDGADSSAKQLIISHWIKNTKEV